MTSTATLTECRFHLRPLVDQLNLIFIKGRAIANARAGLESGTWDLSAWVTNLFDDDTPSRGGLFGTNLNFLTPTLTVTYAPRRQFGVTGSYKF
jgi:outer membrane receptor protein involved in Fe transport